MLLRERVLVRVILDDTPLGVESTMSNHPAMDFSSALNALKMGHKVRRRSHCPDGAVIVLTDSVFHFDGDHKARVAWTDKDLLADDWELVA
jgi:hypothetical protein